ncbi:hypothetical protein CcCBS67573_g06427 [Chytriomyces confervae]|uniref:ABC transporter domain-containing protein n=1 Tax=Chytriomyces confervae TaxID=246404 RepID=A0A507F3D3_9FUNG|nr:hypothetical protein CcCBS67573_g06427 [Chytriomyces confervae]
MNFFKRGDSGPPGIVTATAKDIEAVNKPHRDHIVATISAHISVLIANGWIADQTVDILAAELRKNGMELHRDAHITRASSSPSYTKDAAPPLPHRLPDNTSPLPPYKPTPNSSPPPPSLPLRKPTNVPSYPSSSRTSANFSSNPALQKAAFNAVNDPSVHSSATKDHGVQNTAYGGAATSSYSQKRVSGALASNPAFQKAAAADSRVQSTSIHAARDVGVPKAVHGPVMGHFGASNGQSRRLVVAIADFDASEPDDLPLRTGDVVTVIEDIDDNWYRGELKNGSRGMFPKNFDLPLGPGEATQGDISLIKVDNIRFNYDESKGLPWIFDNPILYEIKMNTRVGIMGPNGAGKSTFLKLITGHIHPTSGTIATNKRMTVAYFGQHSTKELDLEDSALDFMVKSSPKDPQGVLKSHLERTSVNDNVVKNLSFSQRSCVIFAKLTYVSPHLLILDEPTNFLDLETVGSLITACNKFKGSLIITFLSLILGFFLEFDSMKSAKRATYSFMQALEEVQKDIAINNGYRAEIIVKQKAEEQFARDEAERLAREAEEKKAKLAAKVAAQKLDWAAGDVCWAPIAGKFLQVTAVRNVSAVGVTVEKADGPKALVEAKKLKQENPEAGKPAEVPKSAGGAAGAGRGGATASAGGRGGAAGRGRGGR